jgi:hypothetical protein
MIGRVTATNAEIIRTTLSLLVGVGAGVVTLNGLGYTVGFLVGSRGFETETNLLDPLDQDAGLRCCSRTRERSRSPDDRGASSGRVPYRQDDDGYRSRKIILAEEPEF